MIKAHNISKKFRGRHSSVHALKDVSLHITKGDFVSITGPSGSGKSTLLLTLGGMSAPHEGEVIWNEESVYGWGLRKRAEWRAQMVGFMFQTFNLIPYLNVFENIAIAYRLSGKKTIDREKILRITDRVKLSERLDHLPRELSVGQQQPVRDAPPKALASKPAYLEETGERVLRLRQEGKRVSQITRQVCGGPMQIELLTLGHFSRRQLILSYLNHIPPHGG